MCLRLFWCSLKGRYCRYLNHRVLCLASAHTRLRSVSQELNEVHWMSRHVEVSRTQREGSYLRRYWRQTGLFDISWRELPRQTLQRTQSISEGIIGRQLGKSYQLCSWSSICWESLERKNKNNRFKSWKENIVVLRGRYEYSYLIMHLKAHFLFFQNGCRSGWLSDWTSCGI